MRTIGTSAFGLRAPIFKQGDDVAAIVTDIVLNSGIEIKDKDIVAITEAVMGRTQGNYATVDEIADDIKKLQDALLSFEGAKRRSEIIGEAGNCIFVDDYGHHPTAIKTTLNGFRSFYPDRIIIVDFMSHTYTRTAALLEDFASAFGDADEVILHKIYPSAREVYSGGVNGKILFARTSAHHKNVKYFEEVMDAEPYAKERLSQPLPPGKTGYLFITMGAGDNWKLGKALFDGMKNN